MIDCREVGLEFYQTAKYRFQFDVELSVTPTQLFQIFSDEKSWPQWADGISKVEWTSPRPFCVGTTRTVTFPDGTEVYEKFIAWEDGRRMAFILEGSSKPIFHAFGEDYIVTPLDDGRCRLDWTFAYEPRGVFAFIHPVIKPMMGWFLGRITKGLMAYCAAQPRSEAIAEAAR